VAHAITEGAEGSLASIVEALGGDVLGERPISTLLEAHEVIEMGFPLESLSIFLRKLPRPAGTEMLGKMVGISFRTLQRRKRHGAAGRLSREQSGRLYEAAKIVALGIDVFGSTERAVRFLQEPAMALNRIRPMDLLATPAGVELVQRHLARLGLGIYT